MRASDCSGRFASGRFTSGRFASGRRTCGSEGCAEGCADGELCADPPCTGRRTSPARRSGSGRRESGRRGLRAPAALTESSVACGDSTDCVRRARSWLRCASVTRRAEREGLPVPRADSPRPDSPRPEVVREPPRRDSSVRGTRRTSPAVPRRADDEREDGLAAAVPPATPAAPEVPAAAPGVSEVEPRRGSGRGAREDFLLRSTSSATERRSVV